MTVGRRITPISISHGVPLRHDTPAQMPAAASNSRIDCSLMPRTTTIAINQHLEPTAVNHCRRPEALNSLTLFDCATGNVRMAYLMTDRKQEPRHLMLTKGYVTDALMFSTSDVVVQKMTVHETTSKEIES